MRICLFQTGRLSFFLSLSLICPPPPQASLVLISGPAFHLSLLALDLSLPLSLRLIACFLGSKCCHLFAVFMFSPFRLSSLVDPPVSFKSPVIFLTFRQCQSALSLDPFWTPYSCIQVFISPFQLPLSHLQSLLFVTFQDVLSSFPLSEPPPPLRVSLVARCAAGSPPCC